jgi:hypothetical protein
VRHALAELAQVVVDRCILRGKLLDPRQRLAVHALELMHDDVQHGLALRPPITKLVIDRPRTVQRVAMCQLRAGAPPRPTTAAVAVVARNVHLVCRDTAAPRAAQRARNARLTQRLAQLATLSPVSLILHVKGTRD